MIDLEKPGPGLALLHARYVLGQLAAGFLVSVPVQLLLRGGEVHLFQSLAWGIVFLAGSVLLLPLTPFDWSRVNIPRYKRFEATVCFIAAAVARLLFLSSYIVEPIGRNRSVMWFVFVITLFAWARERGNMLLFPAFYRKPQSGGDCPPCA